MARKQSNGQVEQLSAPELLETCDLVVDRVYQGGRAGNAGDDRLSSLLGVSNQGGFRYLGSPDNLKLVVLVSNFADQDWPDNLDHQTGLLTYFGDNKQPGRHLHETPRNGNRVLRELFGCLHGNATQRDQIPPVFVFQSTGRYRDIRFLGLAVPGGEQLSSTEDLVAVWRSANGQRFQNYQATFTILDTPRISRAWIDELRHGGNRASHAPKAWTDWVAHGTYKPLKAEPTLQVRSKGEQLPTTPRERELLNTLYEFYRNDPVGFEKCAVRLVEMMDSNFVSFDLTRPTRDGGRDAVGQSRIGSSAAGIHIDCAVEAKCYSPTISVGVRDVSRLISRLRHRQFGIMVTTSFLNSQAYSEIKEDDHPIVVLAGADLADILRRAGFSGPDPLKAWLHGI